MVAEDRGWVKWRGEREGLARAQGSCWGHGYVDMFTLFVMMVSQAHTHGKR